VTRDAETAPASGSTTQPAWATVDHASSRTAVRWRSATRLPTVMVTAASTPTGAAQSPARSGAPTASTRTTALSPATFDTVDRNAATGSGAPA